jgi:hypothetical protein
MGEIELLLQRYTNLVEMPWSDNLSGAEKVWFIVYSPPQERRLRLRLSDFQTATKNAGHGWFEIDLTNSFAQWMANHKYREAYFSSPELLEAVLQGYALTVTDQIIAKLTAADVDRNVVVVLHGLASLFGLVSISDMVNSVRKEIRGRLLVFFPGHKDGSNYRFMDARDGWNYLSIAITDGTSS